MRRQSHRVVRHARPVPNFVEPLEGRTLCSAALDVGALPPAGPPAVQLLARPLVTRGKAFDFKLVYSSAAGMDPATVGDDVLVGRPGGELAGADVVRARLKARGTRLVVRYRVHAPGGLFDTADNGTYTLALHDGAVRDRSGAAIPEGTLGTFTVASKRVLPPPVVPDPLPIGPTATAGALTAAITAVSAWCDHMPSDSPGDDQFLIVTVVLTNSGQAPLQVSLDHCFLSFAADQLGPDAAGVSVRSALSGRPSGEKTLLLQPGETRTVEFRGDQQFPEDRHGQILYVTLELSAGGETLRVRDSGEVHVTV